MTNHEQELLAVLEKIGQQVDPALVDASAPAVLDASTEVTTTSDGASGPEPFTPPTQMVGEAQDRKAVPITSRNLWVHHDTNPIVFDVALLKQYSVDWFEWEPETLWKEIKEDFRVPSISDHSKAKIQAIKTLHITPAYWEQWEVFCWITQALNNNIPDWQVVQKPSLAQLFASVDMSTMVRTDARFSHDVAGFVAASVLEEGVFYAPHPVEFCQDQIVGFLHERKIEDYKLTIKLVQEKYREITKLSDAFWSKDGDPILHETAVDIQVAKLKVAWDYLSLRRRQLKEQLLLLS